MLIDLVANRATRVLSPNADRLGFTVKNDSAAVIYYGKDRSVAVAGSNQGLIIQGGGDLIFDDKHKGEVWLITAANVNVTVIEDTISPWDKAKQKKAAARAAKEEAG